MCGIAGFCNFNYNYNNNKDKWITVLSNMRNSISHRGNDEFGDYLKNNIGLCHTRLSIVDLVTGSQPITRIVNGNEYTIVYNGETYNTEVLKNDLTTKGYEFKTTTDTEVLLYSFIEYGEKFINSVNGIFALAIWNESNKTLYLFRDRVGIKPLFYTFKDNTLIFGSEIKALFEFPNINPEINYDSLREIIGVGPARTSGNGVFKNINELKAGNYIIFNKNNFSQNKYWELISKEHNESYNDTIEHVSFLVNDSVKRQMISDVPVCTFLSGGIDSSIVTAIASNFLKEDGKILNTFSFDFKENDIYFKSNSFQPERDRPYVDKMLKAYNLNHTYLECNESDLAELLYDAVDAKDLPGMADVDASLLYFCSLVKKHNKVALTGECADEIFGGYPWFHSKEAFKANIFPWTRNMEVRKLLFSDELINKLNIDEYAQNKYNESIKNVPYLDGENSTEKRRREISYLNLKWFMTTLLDRMDRTSMYCGLEARVPFADHRIIEYVWNVPWEYKCNNGVVKSLLREASKNLLPDELLYRKKSPYPKTYNPKYEKILSDKLINIINDNNSPIQPLIDKEKIIKFIKTPYDYGKPWFGQLMANIIS